jgi:polyisoprenoid-binding protein YceI
MKKALLLASFALGAASLSAAPITFDFTDPKGVNAIQFSLDSLLEPISGTATGVGGKVIFDPANPATTTGTLNVAAASLKTSNDTMTTHLVSPGWIDAPGHPTITFELVSLAEVQTTGTTTTAKATGKFTLKGVTKQVTVPVKLTYLAGQLGKRINKPEVRGDLLVIRGEFTILRADYGIKPNESTDKVANEIQLTIAIVGSAPQA